MYDVPKSKVVKVRSQATQANTDHRKWDIKLFFSDKTFHSQ